MHSTCVSAAQYVHARNILVLYVDLCNVIWSDSVGMICLYFLGKTEVSGLHVILHDIVVCECMNPH